MKQLDHFEVVNKQTIKDIIVVSENIRTPENIGMLFRVSEAFGIKKVFLVGDSPNLENKKVLRTARSTEKQLEIKLFKDSISLIKKLKKENYQLVGLELTDISVSLPATNFLNQDKIALFIGAERFGLSKQTLEQLDVSIHIDLFGKNSSINVINALAIALYELTK